MGVSLKVPVAHLLANALKQREAVIAAHAKRVEAFTNSRVDVRAALVGELNKLADAFANGKQLPPANETGWSHRTRQYEKAGVTASVTVTAQGKPDTKPNTSTLDRHIGLLSATTQNEMTLREDADLAAYL